MDTTNLKSMFEGIDDETKTLVAKKLKAELSIAISNVNKYLTARQLTVESLCPPPPLVMNMVRKCPIGAVRVVIVGQDPFIKPGEAMGLCFSVPGGINVPASTKNIYKCLLHSKLITNTPAHGNLTRWAEQGILMLNCALTTVLGKSNEHAECWRPYTDALLREIGSLSRPIVFILLGAFAHEKRELFDYPRHTILTWGHPSPLNRANSSDNPNNFKYCDAFVRANEVLVSRGEPAINWDPDCSLARPSRPPLRPSPQSAAQSSLQPMSQASLQPPAQPNLSIDTSQTPLSASQHSQQSISRPALEPDLSALALNLPVSVLREVTINDPAPLTIDTLWVFTDGAARGNGSAKCSAAWAFYVTDGAMCAERFGVVDEVEIQGKVYKSSNNRGELTAILYSMEFIYAMNCTTYGTIVIVSDSAYCINTLKEWAPAWIKKPENGELMDKPNMDLILPAVGLFAHIAKQHKIEFRHVHSHKSEPKDIESEEWFIWKCNDIVDKYATKALR